MGKKKKQVADKVRNKKKETDKKINPFEVKINRQKQDVLGRKISKHDKGMPGLSRSKAIKKRKQTLLQEYNHRFKSNKFVDKRFGENDATLSVEDKMMKRFVIERMRKDKHNKFSLSEGESELTHYGQSLSEIEKFDDPVISDDEDDEEEGRINAKLVAQEHFGGLLEMSNFESIDKRPWKERMEELISKSKKERHARQMEKEKSQEMTEKIDEEFKDVRFLLAAGMATDRLKTDEEIAKEEKEKLEKLEQDRIRRMNGLMEDNLPAKRMVLHGCFALDNSDKERFHVSYKDGKLLTPGGSDEDDEDMDEDNVSDTKEDSEEEDKDSGESDDGEDDEDEGGSNDESSESDSDSYADLDSDEAEEDDDKVEKSEGSKSKKKVEVADPVKAQKKQELMEAAKKELPYTFKVPDNYEELLDILHGHSDENQLIIIERMRKCHHPSLAEGNKEKLENLFSLLLQYYGDLALQEQPQFVRMEKLLRHLYELCQMSPVSSGQSILDQIKERQEEFNLICDKRNGKGLYPALDTLLLFKLVSILFPTSDFHHHVVTPTFIFIAQMLSQCPVSHERDVAAGLFLSTLCLEFVSMSKRYVPEAINFLHGVLFLASTKEEGKYEAVIPPFKPVGKHIGLLEITESLKTSTVKPLKLSEVLVTDMEKDALSNNEFRLSAISACVKLLIEFCKLYAELPSFWEIFSPVKSVCDKLPVKFYPDNLQSDIKELEKFISDHQHGIKKSLVIQKKKPKSLKMFEPEIEDEIGIKKSKKKRGTTRDFNEKQRMLHKYKKEFKGAMREIRKDTQFLARQQLHEQIEKDEDRKRKVKDLYQMLATQEGDYKAMKRAKKTGM
ncbi:hypothetical protein KUTeg_004814 [Tegillarca granosa]|uniref:Nucleolar protein 14 n=1 Tax=Tegillarca granosa TaxID=220873 RepID=A0ABQ9FHZ0_TEGGR|nr:hypothetical protein KUTeg_004814 [Tegillarca granosa]